MTVFSDILAAHGDPILLRRGDESRTFRGFIQPVMDRKGEKGRRSMTELGWQDTARYYCFGPAEMDLSHPEDATLVWRGKQYRCLRAEPYYVKGQISHWEAVLAIQEAEFDGGI